ncbi:glycosyltransferase family 2 protein [Streptomyces sp. MNU76]|uniref:glycosyltransferase family A protein n=1 Tax=Streptomyces sp. MNU76 TaxID=2560026 RepID=UPI001E4DDC81|nr:glycosyltransferase family A protein [Streptomyces sp. MNU76]MCC9712073.1 glycosyltransferase family 2 protein [Streptomyces sp. MNU76]
MVTTVWGAYGRWLPGWVASVAAQAVRPELVTVVDAGADDLGAAREALDASGLTWQVVATGHEGMGAVRNTAVASTPTEWVMHLDADDVLLPHALTDAAAVAHRADVVSLGAWRDGREVTFPHASARTILRGRLGAFSPSPYRRTLWERRPYITVNDWIESALWVGFAHLGARFVPTRRAGFVYRQHSGSHSHTITAADKQAAYAQLRRLCRRWEP